MASLPHSARVSISELLGVKPHKVGGSDLGEVARPRPCWMSSTLETCAYLSVEERRDYHVVRLLGFTDSSTSWVEPGWHRKSACCMLTLTRVKKRERNAEACNFPEFVVGSLCKVRARCCPGIT